MLRSRPISLITCMITDRIGLHSVQLPLLIITIPISEKKKLQQIHLRKTSPVVKMSNKNLEISQFFFFFLGRVVVAMVIVVSSVIGGFNWVDLV